MNHPPPTLLDTDGLARFFEVTPPTVLEWVRLRRIPFIRVSRRILRFDLDRVVEALEIKALPRAAEGDR